MSYGCEVWTFKQRDISRDEIHETQIKIQIIRPQK